MVVVVLRPERARGRFGRVHTWLSIVRYYPLPKILDLVVIHTEYVTFYVPVIAGCCVVFVYSVFQALVMFCFCRARVVLVCVLFSCLVGLGWVCWRQFSGVVRRQIRRGHVPRHLEFFPALFTVIDDYKKSKHNEARVALFCGELIVGDAKSIPEWWL